MVTKVAVTWPDVPCTEILIPLQADVRWNHLDLLLISLHLGLLRKIMAVII